jgi:uncharacterized protein (DUF58 family)
LTKEAKILFIFLLIVVLILGGVSYLIFSMFFLYLMLYMIYIKKGSLTLKSNVETYTIRQRDRTRLQYNLSVSFTLPFLFTAFLVSPYYLVPASGEKENKFFATRKILSGNVEYVGNRRGVYKIGKFFVTVSDPFGFIKRKIEISDEKTIYVFPYMVPFEKLNIYLSEPVSGAKAKYQLNLDYTSIAGVRDYLTNDPLSMIHWKQTAHRGKLTVKELDFTASKRVQIMVDYYKKNLQFQDAASAIAASIANYSIYHHLPVGLITNGMPKEDIKINKGNFHLMTILKALALASSDEAEPAIEFLRKVATRLEFGSELFFIEKDVNEELMLELLKLKPYVSRLNIILLPDNTFVLPHEKPPRYYFKEAYYLTVLGHSKETLAREGIFVYPILGKDYASKLEMIRR